MKFQHVVISLSTFIQLGIGACEDGLGLGISLSGGYGTISAYFPNGSYIDIAKIEGGAAYKSHMLNSGAGNQPHRAHQDQSPLGKESLTTKYCLFSREICRYWPIRSRHGGNALEPMLKALVAAAECALEAKSPSLAVSIYDMRTHDSLLTDRNVLSTLDKLGIYSYKMQTHVARQVVSALGFGGRCSGPYVVPDDPAFHQDPSKLILYVDYSRTSLTAVLWEEECGLLNQRGWTHSEKLGHDGMETCRRTSRDSSVCDDDFRSALRAVIKAAGQSGAEDTVQIDAVLIIGDEAHDEAMTASLRQALEHQFSNGNSVDLGIVRQLSPDSTFAGSRAAAWSELEAKDDPRAEFPCTHRNEL